MYRNKRKTEFYSKLIMEIVPIIFRVRRTSGLIGAFNPRVDLYTKNIIYILGTRRLL